MFANTSAVRPAVSFLPLSQDDIEDIHAMFSHSARSYAEDQRDLRSAAKRSAPDLTFSLRSVFPGNNS